MSAPVNANINTVNLSSLILKSISYSSSELASKLAPFINHGSKKSIVSPDDLTIVKKSSDAVPGTMNFAWLFANGNKFFDCLFFMSLNDGDRPPIVSVPDGNILAPVSAQEVASALFYQYFFIITRGSTSSDTQATIGSSVPKFLNAVMGLTQAPDYYSDQLASFDLKKIDPSWVKSMPFTGLGKEAVMRFGLGVAGYRAFAPFKLLKKHDNLAGQDLIAYNVAKSMADAPFNWSIHPATRDANILSLYGPLNKNLANLSLSCFDNADLQALVVNRSIYTMPIFDPNFTQYRTWSAIFQVNAANNMF